MGIFIPYTVSGQFAIELKHGWTDSLFTGQFWQYVALFVILWKKVSTQASKCYQYGHYGSKNNFVL